MDNQDKKNFKSLFDSMADYYGRAELSQGALKLYFDDLAGYSFEQVTQAANTHRRDAKQGQFYPKVADLIKHLGGGELTADAIIAAARLKNTPLGILCRIHIGTHDLGNGDSFHLRARAEECLQLLPGWKTRAMSGDYSDHEVSIMIKHDVDPRAPLMIGLMPPASLVELRTRMESIKDTPRHKYLIAQPYSDQSDKAAQPAENVAEFIAIEMMKEAN